MPLKIVRNDITKMKTDAIVNPASSKPIVGNGCDLAVYKAAGMDILLDYRKDVIGAVPEGEAFVTPSFKLGLKCIIHAVSPCYIDGKHGEEENLRKCYRNSLKLAAKKTLNSIAFPLLGTGAFGYPREEGMRIAVDEINAFLLANQMIVYLVVFDTQATLLGEKLEPNLEAYICYNYVVKRREEEYGDAHFGSICREAPEYDAYARERDKLEERLKRRNQFGRTENGFPEKPTAEYDADASNLPMMRRAKTKLSIPITTEETLWDESGEDELSNRISYISDSFQKYLFYLIEEKGLDNADVWKQSLVDKKLFSKIKNNPDYHPKKITALCLCVGAHLSIDETNDLLLRAGYALSPCDITDVIFSYFIKRRIYDMVEIDIQLEEHGVPCIIQ